jgi:succinate dehydrogenase / fumarate reductase iron-sulfur subunit
MVATMDAEGFGGCTNFLECASVCPKEVSPDFIARMNRDRMGSVFLARPRADTSERG